MGSPRAASGLLAGALITRALITRALNTRALITRALITGALLTGLLSGPIGTASASAQAVTPAATTAGDATGIRAEEMIGPQVVNGRVGDPRRFGALVAIADRQRYLDAGLYAAQVCGGTAVTATLIITAAHCVVDAGRPVPANRILVARTPTGALTDPDAQVVAVSTIAVHPDYDQRSNAPIADIAVLRLRAPLVDVEPMLPALPAEDAGLTTGGTPAVVAGWGATTSTGRTFPDRFRVGDLTVFPRSACGGGGTYTIDGVTFLGYGPGEVDADSMICAEGVRDGLIIDSCIGDSGGPLIGGTDGDRRLIGIVSWGPQRCASASSGVYTRVAAFTPFLRAQGVPFAPTPTDAPKPPSIVSTSVTPTTATITVAAADAGATATAYLVTARDASGITQTCRMPAMTADAEPAACTLTDLRTARRYAVTAIAIAGTVASEPSAVVTVRPADRPRRPRIDSVEVAGGGVAVFSVQRLRANGSPFTRRIVVCVPDDRQSGLLKAITPIDTRGIATMTGLSAGADYTCRARVANALGAQRSSVVTLRAR